MTLYRYQSLQGENKNIVKKDVWVLLIHSFHYLEI